MKYYTFVKSFLDTFSKMTIFIAFALVSSLLMDDSLMIKSLSWTTIFNIIICFIAQFWCIHQENDYYKKLNDINHIRHIEQVETIVALCNIGKHSILTLNDQSWLSEENFRLYKYVNHEFDSIITTINHRSIKLVNDIYRKLYSTSFHEIMKEIDIDECNKI